MSTIYKVFNSATAFQRAEYVALTDPASIRQIITALKGEGLVKRNSRIASFAVETTCNVNFETLLIVSYLGKELFRLTPVD